LTTAADVQPDGVPLPILWVGWLVSTGRASAGIVAWPDGLPGFGRSFGFFLVAVGLGVADADEDGTADGAGEEEAAAAAGGSSKAAVLSA
jgi:hypothetical protein